MSLDLFQIECENCGAIMDRDNAVRGVLRCEYCRRSYVLPRDDQVSEVLVELGLGKSNLTAGAFTKAYAAYSKAVELDPKEPEGYFGMALAENKIQYLKDVIDDKLTPVRYEKSGGKFSENAHYKKAVSLATKEQAAVYKEYAQEIDDVFSAFEKLNSDGAQYDCILGTPMGDEGKAEQKAALELYERLKTDGYKPFYVEEESKRFPNVTKDSLELFALVSAKCFITVCFDETRLKNKSLKNGYSRFLEINKAVHKPKNNLTVLFNDKPVEQVPGIYGKLQGICYGDAFAYRNLTHYVDVMLGRVKPSSDGAKKGKIAAVAAALAVVCVGGGVAIALSQGGENPSGENPPIGKTEIEYTLSEQGDLTSVVLNGNKNVTLPSEINGVQVRAVTSSAFSDNTELVSLVLPEGVTSIGTNAFKGCTALKTLTLPSSVTAIGNGAFINCSSLTELILPEDAVYSEGLLSGCSALTKLTFSFENIDSSFGAFFGTEYFNGATAVYQRNTAYYLPNSLKDVTVTGDSLPFGAFQNCAMLSDVTFTGDVTGIPNNAFQGCSALTELTLPQNLFEVGASAFSGCLALKTIALSETVTSVGDEAFMNCSALETAEILNANVTVGTDVFYGCGSLEKFTAPCQTQTLAEYFGTEAVTGMTEVTILDTVYYVPAIEELTLVGQRVKEKGAYGFVNIKTLNLPETLTEIGNQAFYNCVSLEGVDFTHVTSIGERAFEDCSALTELKLPLTIENYGKEIFKGCSDIEKLSFSFFDGNDTFSYLFGESSVNGARESRIVYTSIARENGAYDLPNTLSQVSVIGDVLPDGAFSDCYFIDSVTVGEEITSIGTRTFYGCSELTNFSALSDLTSIAAEAFYECESLVDYPLSETATSLGYGAFYGCKALKNIFIPTAITSVDTSTFQNCTSLESADVAGVLSFGVSAFEGCVSLTDLKISSAESVLDKAFKDCSALQTLEIPSSVVRLDSDALDGLNGLTTLVWSVAELDSYTNLDTPFDSIASATDGAIVTFSDNVTKIPAYLFPIEANIKKISFAGESITEIGAGAFRDFKNLTEVSVPSSDMWFNIRFASETSNPLKDGAAMTVNGAAVTEIIMPSDQTAIGAYQFKGFKSLSSFVFSENLTSVGASAFEGCTGLEKIDVGSIENWAELTTFTQALNNAPLTSSSGELYEKGVLIKELVIPETVTSIGALTFKNTKLTSLTLGTNLSSVGDQAFGGCELVTEVVWNAPNAEVSYKAFQDLGKSADGVEVTIGADVKSVQYNLFSAAYDGNTYNGNINIKKISFAEGCQVWKINSGAFRGAKITELTIPETVTTLNDAAFQNCVNLTEIEIPETVQSISSNVFGNCTSLSSIVWKAQNSAQNVKIFDGSGAESGLTVTLGENVTALPAYFTYGAKVTKLVIPETASLKSIGKYALAGARFTSFTVPETVTYIDTGAFQNCNLLTELTMPFFGTSVGDTSSSTTKFTNLFYGSIPSSLKKLTVTNDDVPASAFYGAHSVEEVVLRKDELVIGKSAFQYMDSLKRVICEGDVLSIDQSAFEDCQGLQTFEAEGELRDVGMNAFYSDVHLTTVSATKILSIGQSSFSGCTALTELPKFVAGSYVGNNSFMNCTGGLNIRADSYADWCSVSFMLPDSNPLSKDNASLYIDGKLIETADLTDVETINSNAFGYYKKLRKVILGESVTKVGLGAFRGCENLAEIETYCKATYLEEAFNGIASSAQVNIKNVRGWCESTFESILSNPAATSGKYFVNGEALVNLEIPEGTNAIGAYSFHNCTTLNTLKVPTSVESGGASAFYKCNLTDIYWNARACADLSQTEEGTSIVKPLLMFNSTSAKEWGTLAITIGEDVEVLPAYLFYDLYKASNLQISSLTFLSKVCQRVGNYMFDSSFIHSSNQIGYVDIADINAWSQIEFGLNYANPLRFTNELRINGEKVGTEIVLDDTFTRIGSSTFEDFDKFGVTKIQIPSAIEEIGACAFEGNSLLTDISIPHTVTKIGAWAFSGCSNATFNGGTTLDFLGNLTELGSQAFSGCLKITELVVPNNPNLNYAANSMFSTFKVENITVEDGVEELGSFMFSNCQVEGTLTVPSSVTSVGCYLFNNAVIGTLVWNANVTGEKTYQDTILASATITQLNIGKNVTKIPDYFAGYYVDYYTHGYASITNVTFEEGSECEEIGDYAFCESRVQSCNFPASLKKIGEWAFYSTAIKTCELSEGFESVGAYAFDYCTSLTKVSLPSTLTYYGAKAFGECKNLVDVYWNAEACADIEHIVEGSSTYYCNPLSGISNDATIVIGNKVKVVPGNLFLYCNAKEIVFEEGSVCEELRKYSFSGTSKVTTITLPASLKTIQSGAIGYSNGTCSITDVLFEEFEGTWKVEYSKTEWNMTTQNFVTTVTNVANLKYADLGDSKTNKTYLINSYAYSTPKGYNDCTWTKV